MHDFFVFWEILEQLTIKRLHQEKIPIHNKSNNNFLKKK